MFSTLLDKDTTYFAQAALTNTASALLNLPMLGTLTNLGLLFKREAEKPVETLAKIIQTGDIAGPLSEYFN